MKTTHTPGPWSVVPGTNHFHIKAADWYVAKTGNDTKEAEANARLMASAPELLKALQDVDLRTAQARIASGVCTQKKRTDFLLSELERIQNVVRAAIAKATGSEVQS
jgi:hypothetical protein